MSIRSAHHSLDILVVGAGIAGLACAYALIEAGHSVRIIERSSGEERRAGGVRIPPNMHKTLVEWGLEQKLRKTTQQCRGSTFHLLETGEKMGYLEWKEEVVRESGGDFLFIHHTDLHNMLRDLAIRAGASITYNTQVTKISLPRPTSSSSSSPISTPLSSRSLDSTSDESEFPSSSHSCPRVVDGISTWNDVDDHTFRPQVHLASGQVLEADLVVGADGFDSVVRKYVCDVQGEDTGMSILTFTIPAGLMKQDADLAYLVDLPEWPMWMGTSRSVLGYPVRQGQEYCVHLFWPNTDILVADDNTNLEDWDTYISTDRIVMDGFEPSIQRLVRMAPDAIRTKFVNRDAVPDWIDESYRIVLLGEAAHPVMPCGIYGSSLGVEDAAVLGVLLSHLRFRSQIPMLLEAYQDIRQPRCQAVAGSEFANASLVWLPPGPARDARDAAMRVSLEHHRATENDQATEAELRAQYEKIAGVFGYSAREAAEDWWIKWGSISETSRGGMASMYEPCDLQFSIEETTTTTTPLIKA